MTTFEDYITTTVTAVSAASIFAVMVTSAISGINSINIHMLGQVKTQIEQNNNYKHK